MVKSRTANNRDWLMRPRANNKDCPLFIYGNLAPNEIGHYIFHDIQDSCTFVKAKLKNYGIYIREGLPLLIPSANCIVEGFIVKTDDIEKYYQAIDSYEPKWLYEWDNATVETEGGTTERVNFLVAKKPLQDEAYFANHIYDIDDQQFGDLPYYDYFKNGLEYLENKYFITLFPDENKGNINTTYISTHNPPIEYSSALSAYDMFELQSGYNLIWTLLDRFYNLRYSCSSAVGQRVEVFQKDPLFKAAIQLFDGKFFNIGETVHASQSSKQPCPFSPDKCLDFYYYVRNNSIHRGKSPTTDKIFLANCFMELFAITSYVFRCAISHTSDEHCIRKIVDYISAHGRFYDYSYDRNQLLIISKDDIVSL